MLGWVWGSIDQALVETFDLSRFYQNFPQTASCYALKAAASNQGMRLPGRVNGGLTVEG